MFAGKCLFLSGLVPRPMNAENDKELLSYGIGFTNIVERTTRANQELSRQEIEEGKALLIVVIEEKQSEPSRVCCILSRQAVKAQCVKLSKAASKGLSKGVKLCCLTRGSCPE